MPDFSPDTALSRTDWTDVTGGLAAGAEIGVQAKHGNVLFWLGPTKPAAADTDGAVLLENQPIDFFIVTTSVWAKALAENSKIHIAESN